MRTIGISAFYHDSAAALIDNGKIVAAAQEERFSRKKHDSSFPFSALKYCLEEGSTTFSEIDSIVFYDKPFLKFERLLETYMAFAPKGYRSFMTSMPVWIREKLFLKDLLLRNLRDSAKKLEHAVPKDLADRLLFSEHHLSHAASAFYPSPFDRALVLTIDGVGEWATTTVCLGENQNLTPLREIHFPHSLGLLYSALTYYTGFKVNSGEYKVMGLAPYGSPKYAQLILDHLIDVKPDGSFRLNLSYFDYCTGLKMTNSAFDQLLGGPARKPEDLLTQKHMDLAASIQAVTEEVILKMTRSLVKETGETRLCLAGGVALNCVANGKILRDGHVKSLWVQPAAGDAGGALGAALVGYHLYGKQPRIARQAEKDSMQGSYLGPQFAQKEIETRLSKMGAHFTTFDTPSLVEKCAQALAEGKALGWFEGRMEFGPRALGARSILADPRSPMMQSNLNLKVKFRESFRPFAPAILREDVSQWFDLDGDSPYMLIVADVLNKHRRQMSEAEQALFGIEKLNVPRSSIPSVTHVDYSARIQTVHQDTNPLFHALLQKFKELTGCPVLVNTSFNVRGEPIVGSPEDAFRCFMGTDLDALAVGNSYLFKEEQNPDLKKSYYQKWSLD